MTDEEQIEEILQKNDMFSEIDAYVRAYYEIIDEYE